MAPFVPTAREICLLTVLLTLLIVFTLNLPHDRRTLKDIVVPYTVYEGGEVSAIAPTLENQYTLQALDRPLRWSTGPVPETKIVAHVPGEWTATSVRRLHRDGWLESRAVLRCTPGLSWVDHVTRL